MSDSGVKGIIGTLAAIIGIFAFITGIQNLPSLHESVSRSRPNADSSFRVNPTRAEIPAPISRYNSDVNVANVKVDRSSGIRLPDEGNNSFSWRNLSLNVNGNILSYNVDVRVWKRDASPITQMFIVIGNEAADCFYNGVPGTMAQEEYITYSGSLALPATPHDEVLPISLIKTLDFTVESALQGVRKGHGLREVVGSIRMN